MAGPVSVKLGRTIVATVLLGGLALSAPASAQAAPTGPSGQSAREASQEATSPVEPLRLPAGWTAETGESSDGTVTLRWSSTSRIPLGDARLEVRAGAVSLGEAALTRNGRGVSVLLTADSLARLAPSSLDELAVWAGGRRLDQPPPTGSGPPVGVGEFGARGVDGPGLLGAPDRRHLIDPDPGARGTHPFKVGTYNRPSIAIDGLPEPVEVSAVVVGPTDVSEPAPLVLFLHGRHSTCYRGAKKDSGDWPCPTGWTPIPSDRGYLETQRLLASQGYVTVSIAANGINGQDSFLTDGGAEARSHLVRHHLRLWSQWSANDSAHAAAPSAVSQVALADAGQVLLVGHSRGGEGVNRAALDSLTSPGAPWKIRGLVHIGPTAFGQNPAPGVPVVVLLPYCDGDVYDLQGQAYVDAAREQGDDQTFRSAVMVLGANHNFFNAEWTPGKAAAPAYDDWWDADDSTCGTRSPMRLSASDERAVGATYTAAAAALFLRDDESVLPMLDGRHSEAASARGAAVRSEALGGHRTRAVLPNTRLDVRSHGAVKARRCRTAESTDRSRQCVANVFGGSAPHFLPLFGIQGEPSRRAVKISWDADRGSARLRLPKPVDLSSASRFELRIAAKPGDGVSRFAVRLVDADGVTATLPQMSVHPLPGVSTGGGFRGKTWAQDVHRPLSGPAATSGLDLTRISRVDLLPVSGSGRVWLLDAWGWNDGLAAATPPGLARVDVTPLRVEEGDTPHTVAVPLRVRPTPGSPARDGRLWVTVIDPNSFEAPITSVIDVPRGTRRIVVDVPVAGNTRDDALETEYVVAVKPVSGLTVGDYAGGVTVVDDDPAPTLSVTTVRDEAVEGKALVWKLTLSEASDLGIFIPIAFVPAEVGDAPEATTLDVSAGWLRRQGSRPQPDRPLSEAGVFLFTYLDPGITEVTIRVPTAEDFFAEGPESVNLVLDQAEEYILADPSGRLTGTIVD